MNVNEEGANLENWPIQVLCLIVYLRSFQGWSAI